MLCIRSSPSCFNLAAGPRNLSRNFSRHLRCNSVVVVLPRFITLAIVTATLVVGLTDCETGVEHDEDDEEDDDAEESDRRGGLHLSVGDVEDEEDDDDEEDDLLRFRTHDDSSCLYRYDLSANDLPQRVHVCGLVFECVWMWARRFDLSANALLQMEHSNGFSPVSRKDMLML